MTIHLSSNHSSQQEIAQFLASFGENAKEEDQKWRTAKMEVLQSRMMFQKTEERLRYHD